MLLGIDHVARMTGTPKGHRNRKTMSVRMNTAVEIAEYSASEAGVAFLYTEQDGTRETRSIGSRLFERHPARGLPFESALSPGGYTSQPIGVLRRENAHFAPQRFHEDRLTTDRSPRPPVVVDRENWPVVLDDADWGAPDADRSAYPAAAEAVRKVAENLVLIDGLLWCRRFEPCRTVEWNVRGDRTRYIHVGVGSTAALSQYVDGAETHDLGFKKFGDRSFVPADPTHRRLFRQRCFSMGDDAGIAEFVEHLEATARHGSTVRRWDQAERDLLELLDADAASPGFEALEAGRSARDLISAVDDLRKLSRLGSPRERTAAATLAKAGLDPDSFAVDIRALADAIIEADGNPEDSIPLLADATEPLHVRVAALGDFMAAKRNIVLEAFVPERHFAVTAGNPIHIYDVHLPRP